MSGQEFIPMLQYTCPTCGSVVANVWLHESWHDTIRAEAFLPGISSLMSGFLA